MTTADQMDTEIQGDERAPAKEILRKKYGQQDSSTAGGRRRGQHKTERMQKSDPLGVTKHKPRKSRDHSQQYEVGILVLDKWAVRLVHQRNVYNTGIM